VRGLSGCIAVILSALLFASAAFAQNITGTVINGTTGKPSAGDEVSLLSLAQGMQEIGSTKTDAQGHFSFPAPADTQTPHMVRVTHQGVSYFPPSGPLMPGSTRADLTVYDAAAKVDGLSQTVEVDRFQSDGKQLEAIALFAISNQSQPPRTVANDKGTFEFVLPAGAQIDSAEAKAPDGQPIAAETTAGAQKNHYWFSYPLRPGETQFQVAYHMPYSGEASFSPKLMGEVQHFVVMLPKSMSFAAKDPQQFQSMSDPRMISPQTTVLVATNVKPGEDLSFRIAGTGTFPAEDQQGGGESGGAMGGSSTPASPEAGLAGGPGSQAAANDDRPGGGLGAPIDAPDPLHDYRVYILGAFALVLVMGGAYVVSRSNQIRPAMAGGGGGKIEAEAIDDHDEAALPAKPAVTSAGVKERSALLLEAMKEELFQLEIDRQAGKITPEEYAKAKAALDETIKRAVARGKSGR